MKLHMQLFQIQASQVGQLYPLALALGGLHYQGGNKSSGKQMLPGVCPQRKAGSLQSIQRSRQGYRQRRELGGVIAKLRIVGANQNLEIIPLHEMAIISHRRAPGWKR